MAPPRSRKPGPSDGRRRSTGRQGGSGQTDGQGRSGRPQPPRASAGRRGASGGRTPPAKKRRDLTGAAAGLPRWVVESLSRVTPAPRVGAALDALGQASEALSEARYHAAVRYAARAKELAPRDSTVRETLGVAAYRVGDWATALTELRAFRRMSGEATHLPIEMDVLRALGRPADVVTTWKHLAESDATPAVMKEGRVVYASFLLDSSRPDEAYAMVRPRRLKSDPLPEDLRVWYVAARAAAATNRGDEARRLRNAILEADPAFPGMDELEVAIARSST